jgi:hypothetical protein
VLGGYAEGAARLAYMEDSCCNPGTIHAGHGTMCPMSNSQQGTIEGLKQWVARREGVPAVSEPIWQMLEEEKRIAEWRTEDPELRDKVRDQILARYRRLKRFAHEVGDEVVVISQDGQEGGSTSLRATLPAGDPVALRAEALCLYWAKLAEADQGVRRFRKNVLGGAVVSESKAHDFIRSPNATRLHKLAADLCQRYPWEPQDAAWYILTGEAPWVPPLTAHIKRAGPPINHGTITIAAASWAPKNAVSKFYAELKARYVDPAPTPSPRRLAVFRFVVERSQAINRWESSEPGGAKDVRVRGLDTPTWPSLQTQWNEQHPPGHEWHYGNYPNLRRDFIEAHRLLLGY